MLFDVSAALAEILAQTPATFATSATSATNSSVLPPVSRMSRVSQLGSSKPAPAPVAHVPAPASPQTAVLAAIRAGNLTPGAIATATKLGATASYQELDRLAKAGPIEMASNGTYSLANDATARKKAQT